MHLYYNLFVVNKKPHPQLIMKKHGVFVEKFSIPGNTLQLMQSNAIIL